MAPTEKDETNDVSSTSARPVSGLVVWSRYLLLVLAALFVAGATGQVFRAGFDDIDSASRWADHASLGHALGPLAFLLWTPALVGRTGGRLIAGSMALAVHFGLQYAFLQSGESVVQVRHLLNGRILFELSLWIGLRGLALVRRAPRSLHNDRGRAEPRAG